MGQWTVDGRHRPDLDGLDDVDLEASVVTNTLPVHRLDLRIERIAQTYELLARTDDRVELAYTAPGFGVACTLVLDGSGLVLDYPGLAVRHG